MTLTPTHTLTNRIGYQSPPPLRQPQSPKGEPESDLSDSFAPSPRIRVSVGEVVLAGLSVLGLSKSLPPKVPEAVVQAEASRQVPTQLSTVDLVRSSKEHKVATSDQIQEATDWALDRSYASVPSKPGESRHDLRRRVQAETRYNGADVVVIAFEGTAGFHPRKAAVIQSAAAHLAEQDLKIDGNQGSLSQKVSASIQRHEGRDPGWSGLNRGPLEELVRDPEMSQRVQWLSFPSEELEVLSGLDGLSSFNLSETVKESYDSYRGETPGIDGALETVRDILIQAEKQGKQPKFMLISHSSGGRSMVKFLEKAKSIKNEQGEMLRFSTALTIDPVREAQEALLEGTGQFVNKSVEHGVNRVRNLVGLPEREVWPPVVQHRSQPESLYAPGNVDKFSNFFQKRDTQGLGIGPSVGIHGSPVEGAHNEEIKDVGHGGHGEITSHKRVLQAFLQSLHELL